MELSERIYNAFLGEIISKVVLAEWFTDAKQLEAELSKANFEVGWQMGKKETLRELFIDLLAAQGLVTAKREVEIPEEPSATLDIGLPLARRIVDALLKESD